MAVQLSGKRLKTPELAVQRDIRYLQVADDYLRTQRFVTNVIAFPAGDAGLALEAARDQCRIIMLPIDPNGWNKDWVVKLGAEPSRTFFVTRSGIFSFLPSVFTAADFYGTYVLNRLGANRSDPMVFAIIAKTQCDLADVGWNNLYAK